MPAQQPAVSVIMPVLNEERHLRDSVRHILGQEYAGEMEVVIALGPSTDRTDEIAAELVRETASHPRARVHTVPNPTGRTPAALNAAIKASRHPIVVRVDGHGMLSPNYIATASASWRRPARRTSAASCTPRARTPGRTPSPPR